MERTGLALHPVPIGRMCRSRSRGSWGSVQLTDTMTAAVPDRSLSAPTEAPAPQSRAWARARRPLNALLRSRAAGALIDPLVSPRSLDDFLELVDPCWSRAEVRARVLRVRRETSEVTSLWLEPNDNWRGHRAGQHVSLGVRVDGVRHTRSFTLSAAPTAGAPLRVTIKAHPEGRVSSWARDHARPGDVVSLSQAQGEFVLPDPLPPKLLFVSGGSGLTPLVAMSQALLQARYAGSLRWLHFEREELPLASEIETLIAALPDARFERVHTGRERSSTAPRHLDVAQLEALESDWADFVPHVCGPRPLLQAVRAAFATQGLEGRVRFERFQLDWPDTPAPVPPGTAPTLSFDKSGRTHLGRTDLSLLQQAEQAGLQPKHGCRMGICHSCTCKKRSGTVRNVLTGQSSSARDEAIRLCIHIPLSDVSLDL